MSKTIVEYVMAYTEGSPTGKRSGTVQAYLDEGYQPYGSPVVDREFIMQAMVIYDDDPS